MWAGIECTLNRVEDRYANQCEKNGHTQRLGDLALFHGLGIQKLRYPCLWELVAPQDLDHCDWGFLDERLGELKNLGQSIIAGLLHHGSGPRYTSLIDPDFPTKFATYARLFVTRYPWVTDFTPINEINTTARFSMLYGHWYPHLKDEALYLRSLLLQCRGTILSMREIRSVNPAARLIQTDDLGKCQSTPELVHQRDFDNERRWLSWDLLCGRVTPAHALYEWFLQCKIHPRDLAWFEENACPPDVIGINHYHLSNRYLDQRLELFPAWSHGGNGRDAYADVGAVDTGLVTPVGIDTLLRETWERYHIPIAVTECHARGRREAQMRWLDEVWKTCQSLRAESIPIEAVTAWSLLGTYDWHNLCTNCEFFYESGVFDLRNAERVPQETGLSKMVRALANTGDFQAPILGSPGIWKTGRRILFNAQLEQQSSLEHDPSVRPVLIIGASGTLGRAFARTCGARNIKYLLLPRNQLELTDLNSIKTLIQELRPWAIINAAGYVRVEAAETDYETCYQTNVVGAVNLASVCREEGVSLVNFSSDLVFDGTALSPSGESTPVRPLNNYGKSKAACEEQVLEIDPRSLMIRTSAFFGPWDEHNFVTQTLRTLGAQSEVHAASDQIVSPTYVPDLTNETLDLLIDGECGLIHLANVGEVSWEEFAWKAVNYAPESLRLDPSLIRGVITDRLGHQARMPRRSSLTSERQQRLPSLEDALARYFLDVEVSLTKKQEHES